jgi:hypothetical protein
VKTRQNIELLKNANKNILETLIIVILSGRQGQASYDCFFTAGNEDELVLVVFPSWTAPDDLVDALMP